MSLRVIPAPSPGVEVHRLEVRLRRINEVVWHPQNGGRARYCAGRGDAPEGERPAGDEAVGDEAEFSSGGWG